MEKAFIIKYGEIALKGMNKPYFERLLMERIRVALKSFSGISVKRYEGVVFVKAAPGENEEAIAKEISKVFGVSVVSLAAEVDSEIETIYEAACEYMKNIMSEKQIETFKVEVKRSNKQFPVESPLIARGAGGRILEVCEGLKVDVHHPQCQLFVDVRRDHTYIYHEKMAGYGGLPLGTNGKGMVLLSGGIDSPVAAWQMAKRGMLIEAVHFHAFPYTSERAQEKVIDLTRVLASYCGRINVHCVNLLEIQQAIALNCPEEDLTIITRRFMMKIAQTLAKDHEADVLITGENIGQVASQTVKGLVATDHAVDMPVMRPLIAYDKVDIIEVAKKIETFEISIQPFEDCCTVFLPKHPSTKPRLEKILQAESLLDGEALMEKAIKELKTIVVNPQ